MRKFGRVYIERSNAAPGTDTRFRGPIEVDACGVYIDGECEGWPGTATEWHPVAVPRLIPWHRVALVEWQDA